MPLPKITIEYLNGQLGTVPQSQDGLLVLAVSGATAVPSTFVLGTPYLIYRPAGLDSLGVTEANNARLVELVRQFYSEADEGTSLYVVGYSSSDTFPILCDKDTGKLRGLLQSLKGAPRGIVLASAVEFDTEDTTEGLADEVITALPKAQLLAEYAADSLYAPVFIALEGCGYKDAAGLEDLSSMTYNRCCVVLGDVAADTGHAAMGTFAGRVAASAVQMNIGRVLSGPLYPTQMYLGSALVDDSMDDIETIYGKGYITPRVYVGRTGYFFTDDSMACDPTDDYAHLTARRTIDKAARIAYDTLLDYVLGEIEINEDGTMQQPVLKNWQAAVEDAVNSQMTAGGELSATDGSGCSCFIDPDQNVLSTSTVNIVLRVRPFGYARFINVQIGFLVTSSNS